MWPTLIAVVGTLAGATLTFFFQTSLATRARDAAAGERLRIERLDSVAELGTALVAYRHSQLARQRHRLREPLPSSPLAEEVRLRRGDAWSAYFKVELLTSDSSVLEAAAESMQKIRALKNLGDLEQLDVDAEKARLSIHHVMRLARDRLRFLDPQDNRPARI